MKRRTAPWHSPSECSFDHGYRIGVLDGKILALRKAMHTLDPMKFHMKKELKRLLKKQKVWKEGRPK